MNKNTLPSPFTPEEFRSISHEFLDLVECHGKLSERTKTFLHSERTKTFLQYIEELHFENIQSENPACIEELHFENIQSENPAWMPYTEERIVLDSKVRRIEFGQTNPDDTFTKLRSTWLGRVYTGHLKQYSAIRWIVIRLWRNGFPIYANLNFSNYTLKRWRALTPLSKFAKKTGTLTYKLTDAEVVNTPVPDVFPICDQSYLVSPHDHYTFPEVSVATLSNATTYGGTNLILADKEVICHDLYNFKRDYTSEELHGRTMIAPKLRRIRWLLHDKKPESIPVAATFIDACAPNYAHWLTEVLPRIAAFCSVDQFNGIPIVVNDGLHKNIMESLFAVAGTEHEIVTLPIGRALQVDKLYLTSVAGYVPFERRNHKLPGHSHGMFSPTAFELIRKRVSTIIEQRPQPAWPEKIYVRRNSGTRKIKNATELEELLIGMGYKIVEPEKFTFLQQAQLFSHAKVIIGSSGAALANIIFVPSNARVFILISKHPDTSYWYWQNIACASGKTISYVLGEATGGVNGIHADFMIDLDDFARSIE